MAGRGHVPPRLDGRSVQTPILVRQGLIHSHWQVDRLPPPDHLENKIAAQAAEIDRLEGDNHRLAANNVALRQVVVDMQQEVEQVKAHFRSIQTENNIQVKVLLDKVAKMESEIRLGENVKKELRQAHLEAQSLAKAGQELTTQIQQASEELQKYHADVRNLPDLQAELDDLRRELKRLRAMFEYEKGLNIEKVEKLQAMEQNLIRMAREVEKLYAEVLNAEKKPHAPNPYDGYVIPGPSYPHPVHGSAAYVDAYGRSLVKTSVGPPVDGTIPYTSGNGAAVIGGIGDTVGSSPGGVATWEGNYDLSVAEK